MRLTHSINRSAAFISIPTLCHTSILSLILPCGKIALTALSSCHNIIQHVYANVRRVMLRHKRAAKCPLLSKFLNQCVTTEEGNFVSTSELFSAYETAVSIRTDDHSVHGQTKFLMNRSAFNRVSSKVEKENILRHWRWNDLKSFIFMSTATRKGNFHQKQSS